MPYIKYSQRRQFYLFDDALLLMPKMEGPGELNYLVTCLCKQYLEDKKECYQTYNDIMGALEGAKLEIYRRKISEMENKKIIENGDVY